MLNGQKTLLLDSHAHLGQGSSSGSQLTISSNAESEVKMNSGVKHFSRTIGAQINRIQAMNNHRQEIKRI